MIKKFILKNEKKAWLRIIEAFLAVLIIFAAIVTVIANKESKTNLDKRVYERSEYVLDLIQKNDSMRFEALTTNLGIGFSPVINSTIYILIPRTWNYGIKICKIDDICKPAGAPSSGKDVYYSEKIFTANLDINSYSPRKLVLAVWMK